MFSVRALTALAVLSEEFCHPVRVLFGYISRFFLSVAEITVWALALKLHICGQAASADS